MRGLCACAPDLSFVRRFNAGMPIAMYESFFLLRQRPFSASPDLYHYFPSPLAEQAREQLVQCIEHGAGPALLIGPPGTGKSLLCQLIADHFQAAYQVVTLSHSTVCTRRALFQSLLYALRCRTKGSSEGALRLAMWHHLESRRACPNGVLAIIDEAHKLPIVLLEELRVLTNCVLDGHPRFRLLLAGGPALEERFTDPELETFNQRLGTRAYLQPLVREETAAYVRALIAAADGVPDEIFTDEALRAFHYATDGIPRLINQLGNAALTMAARQQRRPIDRELVEHAWAELQQLPTPAQTPADSSAADNPTDSNTSFIEFGALSDGMNEMPEESDFVESLERDAGKAMSDETSVYDVPAAHNAFYDQIHHVAAQLERPLTPPASGEASGADEVIDPQRAESRRLRFRFDPPVTAFPSSATSISTSDRAQHDDQGVDGWSEEGHGPDLDRDEMRGEMHDARRDEMRDEIHSGAVPAPHFLHRPFEHHPNSLRQHPESRPSIERPNVPHAQQDARPLGHELQIVPDEVEPTDRTAGERRLDQRHALDSDRQKSRANRMDYRLLFAQLRRRQ